MASTLRPARRPVHLTILVALPGRTEQTGPNKMSEQGANSISLEMLGDIRFHPGLPADALETSVLSQP
jgi:hypothetical protein